MTVHALSWLVIANAVGLLLATLLLLPRLGEALAPLSYGRWMPLHLNLQLYGWCALPIVGLLIRLYQSPAQHDGPARLAVRLWSAALAVGAVSWLAGHSSGKLFLDWSGPPRLVLALALAFLHLALCTSYARGRREALLQRESRLSAVAKGVLLLVLLPVPWILYTAASPSLYPPVNPATGGPTGVSLLGSTLVVVALFWAAPWMLALPLHEGGSPSGNRVQRWGPLWLALHFGLFALLPHGDQGHHEPVQWLGLASVLVWLPLLGRHLRRFAWPPAARRWGLAMAGWGTLLGISGVITFLPGVLDSWKFTHALVAHAHIAMAGLVTSFNALVLLTLPGATSEQSPLAHRGAFWCWQGGAFVHVAALLILGTLEAIDPTIIPRFTPTTAILYSVRWLSGAAMLAASGHWLAAACTTRHAAQSPHALPSALETPA